MPRSKSRTARTSARRRRPSASRPRKQRGGSRTVLPISYFGGDDSAAYTGKCGRSPIQTAYGGSVPTSFGELGTSLGADFAGPNLAPGNGVDGVSASALQTGGARRRRKSARRKSARRQPTRRSRARRSRRTRTQRGGGGQYGRTVMPIKYFGGDDTKAYSAPCGRTSFNTSYGRSVPTSFGGSAPELGGGFRGPNLAPGGMGEPFAVTGIQTGGGVRSLIEITNDLQAVARERSNIDAQIKTTGANLLSSAYGGNGDGTTLPGPFKDIFLDQTLKQFYHDGNDDNILKQGEALLRSVGKQGMKIPDLNRVFINEDLKDLYANSWANDSRRRKLDKEFNDTKNFLRDKGIIAD